MRTPYPVLLGITCCAFLLSCPVQTIAQVAPSEVGGQPAGDPSQAEKDRATEEHSRLAVAELPDSPGSTLLQVQDQSPSGVSQTTQSTGAGIQSDVAPSDTAQKDQKLQRPVGAAAAEAPKVSGITAAQPAGVAIAPAKQRRVRTVVLKVGAIVAAGAAVGTVIALTAATHSKPPGAH